MKTLNYKGRTDGIGNRIEEIILLESIADKEKVNFNYVWQNEHKHRSYKIFFSTKNVKLIEDSNINETFKLSNYSNCLTQNDILVAAKHIKPIFNIKFDNRIKPVGIHIRGTDRIGKVHPHFMKSTKEFNLYLSKTIELLNHTKPKYIFICSDDYTVKNKFIQYLDKEISVINPICESSIPPEYKDFFSLTLCSKIYMCSKFSSFSIVASLIGNIPLISYVYDEAIKERYKALFEYNLDFDKIKYIKIVQSNDFKEKIINYVLRKF